MRTVRPDLVVFAPPALDHDARLIQAVEDPPVEQLVPEHAVEALAVAVLPGVARFDLERVGADPLQPFAQRLGGELRAIVRADVLEDAAP